MNLLEALKDKEISGEKLASIAASQVNNFTRQTEILNQILNDEEAYAEFKPICIAFVESLATENKEPFWHDGRNEYACRAASVIMDYDGIKPFLELTTWDGTTFPTLRSTRISMWERRTGKTVDRAGEFALYMSNEHRTLQQSFAELAFVCISTMFKESGDENFEKYMSERLFAGGDWTRTPLI